ncbi:FAD-dependent oxidoreductase [Sagittula sp. SSi028]|uniref:FAD-dependent oxidoreductase n=1 Tax=Sagittula sp. SSi028 TaxID=3400636 RepID=UPI003AF5022B
MTQATVLGAGVAGLCVATELVARGVSVTVYDPRPAPGPHGCSWWAGGMLAPFCEGETAEDAVLRHGRGAAAWWQAQGVELHHRGTLVVTLGRDRRELDRFARRTQDHEVVDAADLGGLEPDLQGRFSRGLFFDQEAHLTPRAALARLQAGLVAAGVCFATTPPRAGGLTFDCRGLAARDVLHDLRGVKGEMAVLRCPELALTRPVRLLHPRYPLYVVPRGDGVYMLGATQIESHDTRPRVRSVLELLSAAYALHPAFGEAELVEIGCDARPAFADNLPRLRRRGQTYYLNGLFRHGFLLAPALAQMAVAAALDHAKPEFMDEDHD